DKERHHFAPAEIVDRGVPVGVETLARIGMLIERGAVEMDETVLVDRKMRRYPVEDDADAGAMRAVDETRETVGIAEARGRRIKSGCLITPGRIVGMLGNRQELDVGEAGVDHIGDQARGKLVPGQERAVVAALP